MTINNANPALTIALDPEAFKGEGENAATRRYLAEEIVNRLDHLATFAGCDIDDLLTRIARYRVQA